MRSNKTRDGIAAILADNLGQVEEDVYEVKQEWEQQHSKFSEMEAAMEQAGLRLLNGPNLLKQNWWTNNSALGKNVVYGNDSRWSGTSYPYLSSYNSPTEYTQTTAPTAAELAECCAYYTSTEEGVTTYHLFKDEDDIRASVVDLATADQITELDDEVYAKAIQFDITANSTYGNAEWLMYCHPSSTRVYTQGDTKVSNYGQIEEMQPGRKYTMSFWARVISGDGAYFKCGYGGSSGNTLYTNSADGRMGVSDYMEIKGSAWKRYSWTFEFNPTGDWYTETSAVVDGVTKITRSYNWYKKVCFGFCRKYTAVIQVCGFRLVEGNLWITDTYDDLDEGLSETKDRVTALETGTETTKNAILSIFAESDTATATANHAVGDLFVMGGKMYKATAAIATGETITVGTNCAETTTEGYFAPKSNPVFGGSVSLFRLSGSTVGSYSSAVGMMVEASSFASHAEGTTTHATANSSHAEGNDTTASGDYSHAEGYTTTASARDAHAEGSSTTASGINAHAEGSSTTASQINAHAEGSGTTASGASSHAEGVNTTASGNNAHAEGAYTIANHATQHVFGKYNVADPAMTDATTEGNYIEIVGNGRSTSERHNARTLDWSGNEALAGGLTLGKGTTDEVTITAAQLKALLALLS